MTIRTDDILDLRMLAQDWRGILDTDLEDRDEDWNADVSAYEALCEDLGIPSTPDALEDHGDSLEPTLIADSYFETYAQELASDLGMIDPNATWPLNRIDWEAAASDLQMDYFTVRLLGEVYWIRAS